MIQDTDRPSQADLAKLIKAFDHRLIHFGPRKAEEVQSLATMFELNLPSDYRQFLGNYGALIADNLRIYGLADTEHSDLSAENVTFMLRLAFTHMPLEVIPIEDLGNDQYVCLICPEGKNGESPVVIIDVENPIPIDQAPVLAPGFRDYLYNRLLMLLEPSAPVHKNEQNIQETLKIFEKHILQYNAQFQYDHATGGKLPRNHDWRPYRYCIQDVLFGATVVRHLREANCLQVDVFLTADIPEYGPLAGALALISFLLSEAYKCGGTMEVRFTKNVEDGQVPQELQDLARQYEIVFSQADNGKILPSEAKALYAALTGFSPSLKQKIYELEQAGRVKMARACYVVHHGVWSKEQVEMIVLGSEQPDSVLSGQTQAHQRHLYLHDLLHARAALLGGMLDRVLSQRQRISDDGVTYDMEDDVRTLTISFDGELYAKKYHSDDEIPLPWLYPDNQTREVPGGMPFNVLVRARDISDLQLHLAADVKQAADYRQKTQQPTLLLLPNDFMVLPDALRQKLYQQAQTAQIGLMVCPDPVSVFDVEAAEKLARSRILRQ